MVFKVSYPKGAIGTLSMPSSVFCHHHHPQPKLGCLVIRTQMDVAAYHVVLSLSKAFTSTRREGGVHSLAGHTSAHFMSNPYSVTGVPISPQP